MRPDTKRHLHIGVNFLFAPASEVSTVDQLRFQQRLAEPVTGIVFDATVRQDQIVTFERRVEPLQVKIGAVGPQVGQLLIVAPQPNRSLEDFIGEAESVVEAFQEVWPGALQLVRRDCTIRHLYAVQEDHAFRFLWERRLQQQGDSLSAFGRPVIGGGLRFVMPPRPEITHDSLVEVKIESLLADSTQLFVDASFVWEQPLPITGFDVRAVVEPVEEYLENEVTQFILWEPT